ncbi:MAG: hypothetical protein ACYTGZ_15715 [Planctomycetota bacterium]|jgi:tetratricopeptide (TPR) repeat protein
MRASLPIVLLAAVAAAEDPKPEPGRISLDLVEVRTLQFRPRGGDAQTALKTWLEAHRLHKENKIAEALDQYIAFLGMPGHRALPGRYGEIARRRVEKIHEPIRKRFEAACAVYKKDRKKALDVWRILAVRWIALPEGNAARKLWHSDEQRGAIDRARRLKAEGKAKEAIPALERAIRKYQNGLFLYEARTLLVEIGGPDLRPKKDKEIPPDREDPEEGKQDDDDGESEIEVGDD